MSETMPRAHVLPKPKPITDHDWPSGTPALVSICCNTFNHAAYISDCIDGFLAQRTTFPVEIIVHDDASTDGTDRIVAEYARAYPRLIQLITQTNNQYSQGVHIATEIVLPVSRGRYIATCEGDDYWVDPEKIETQVRFLEEHRNFVMSFHDAFVVDESGNLVQVSKLPDDCKRDFSGSELMRGLATILPQTRVVRRCAVLGKIVEQTRVLNRDTFTTAQAGRYGAAKYHPEIAKSVYRWHSGGVWSTLPIGQRREAQVNTNYWIYRFFDRVGDSDVAAVWKCRWLTSMVRASPTNLMLRELLHRLRSGIRRRLTRLTSS